MKSIDGPTGRIGVILRRARTTCNMSQEEASILLHITQQEICQLERGTEQIPADIIERMFLLAYKSMRMRVLENIYKRRRKIYRRLQEYKKSA